NTAEHDDQTNDYEHAYLSRLVSVNAWLAHVLPTVPMRDSIGDPMAKLDLGADAPRRNGWPDVLDKLILGVTHQISNRVATLAGVSDILAGDPAVPPILRALSDEVPKLEESIRLLRLLAAPEHEAEEALEAHRLVDDAIALARLHPDAQDVDYIVESGRDTPPVLARPVALTHELLVALVSAAADGVNGGAVTVNCRVVGADLVISAGAHEVAARLLTAARAGESDTSSPS
ncbi:MAG: hypothetical protein ACR2KM_10265, partial [Gemmatimonadaceae bacterium]